MHTRFFFRKTCAKIFLSNQTQSVDCRSRCVLLPCHVPTGGGALSIYVSQFSTRGSFASFGVPLAHTSVTLHYCRGIVSVFLCTTTFFFVLLSLCVRRTGSHSISVRTVLVVSCIVSRCPRAAPLLPHVSVRASVMND